MERGVDDRPRETATRLDIVADSRRAPPDPELIRVCLVCGAELEDRACKLVCRCGYFLSCSDYL